MTQTNPELNLQIQPGAPATAVPRSWFLFVNNIFRFLNIQNGRLFVNGDKWTIECGGGFDVAGTQEEFKVIQLVKDENDQLVPTWDYWRLP